MMGPPLVVAGFVGKLIVWGKGMLERVPEAFWARELNHIGMLDDKKSADSPFERLLLHGLIRNGSNAVSVLDNDIF